MPPLMPDISHTAPYRLDNQIDFILRQVNRHYAALFADGVGSGLTLTQWAALICLGETGPCLQNQLGQPTAMDAVIIEGVAKRLDKWGLIQRSADPDDGRRLPVSLNPARRTELEAGLVAAHEINRQALVPFSPQEQEALRGLLTRPTWGHYGLSFFPRYIVRSCVFRRSGLPLMVHHRYP